MIGTKKHLIWVYERLGPLAYTNPSLLIAKSGDLLGESEALEAAAHGDEEVQSSDFMRILCPKCKCRLNVRL